MTLRITGHQHIKPNTGHRQFISPTPRKPLGPRDCRYCGWTVGCGEVGCRVCDNSYYG